MSIPPPKPTDDIAARAGSRRGLRGRFGPGLVTAALIFGPGSVTTASSMGASFGYELIWIPVIGTFLMLCFVDLGVRIGLSTDQGPIGTVMARLGVVLGIAVALGALLVVGSFQAGNSAGSGAAATVLVGGDPRWWAVGFTLLAVGFVWLPAFYKRLETFMVVIIVVMLLTFIVTAVVSQPDLGEMVRGMVPSLPEGSNAIAVGAVATTFSVVGAFYQIQLVREKGWGPADYRAARADATLGSLILGFLSLVITVGAAAVLQPLGVTVQSPADMARVLEPSAGAGAAILFAVGLWAAAFSSLIGNSSIGGTMLAALVGRPNATLSSTTVRTCITVVMVAGGAVAFIFGGIPVQLILTAQAVTIFAVPLIGVVMVYLARHRDRGALVAGRFQTLLGALGIAFLVVLAITYLRGLIG